MKASQTQPTQWQLQCAFNRTLLRKFGYTLETALACPAIKIALVRVAQALAKPSQPSHMRGAIND